MVNFPKFSLVFLKNNQKISENVYTNTVNSEGIIKFLLENYETTINLNDELFIRENEDFKFILDIKNKICQIHLKNEDMSVDIEVDKCSLKKMFNKVEIEYTIETEDCSNKIIITEMSE